MCAFHQLVTAALVTAALFLSHPGQAKAEQRIVCPSQVDARQITVAASPGWKGLYRPNSAAHLRAARVWVGAVEDGPGELIGDIVKLKDGSIINRFPALDVAPLIDGARVPQEKWMVCTYGDEGIVQAVKLPAEVRQCDVIYRPVRDTHGRKRKLVEVLSEIVCK